ncbi:MAG: hypothetical protein LUE12_04090 [Ruminococcus sp.]|nr:hypothetical protein [Ruminococcus sp.]
MYENIVKSLNKEYNLSKTMKIYFFSVKISGDESSGKFSFKIGTSFMPVVLDETKKKCSRLFIKENVFKLLKADLIPVFKPAQIKRKT